MCAFDQFIELFDVGDDRRAHVNIMSVEVFEEAVAPNLGGSRLFAVRHDPASSVKNQLAVAGDPTPNRDVEAACAAWVEVASHNAI